MILGIDAFNIRAGGGVTHLVELLRAADPVKNGFEKVIVWGCSSTLCKIDDRSWLLKKFDPLLDRSLLHRIFWEKYRVRKLAEEAGCSVLFIPGGSDAGGFLPSVSMSQNLLPFDWRELRRYGWSFLTVKFLILRWSQAISFRKVNGVIFLSEFARATVLKVTGRLRGSTTIIPHGINPKFFNPPKPQRSFCEFTPTNPCRLLYVSVIELYKHQWHVAQAIAILRSEGFHVTLELVGAQSSGKVMLEKSIKLLDPSQKYIFYRGKVPYENINNVYAQADIGVFASSCENMPNILLEGMAAGLPMASSHRGPMPDMLGDAGVYFNPEDPKSIVEVLRNLIRSHDLRQQLAQSAFFRAQNYSWQRCAEETFNFLERLAKTKKLQHRF